MKPYIVVTGTISEVESFEDKVSSYIEEGYDLCSKLKCKTHTNPSTGQEEVMLIQALILDEFDEEEDDDEEYIDIEEELSSIGA